MARSTGKTQFNVLIPDKLATQVRVIAEVEDRPASHLVEQALKDYVEHLKADPDWSKRHSEWVDRQKALLKAL